MLRPFAMLFRVTLWVILSLVIGSLVLLALIALTPLTIVSIETLLISFIYKTLLHRKRE